MWKAWGGGAPRTSGGPSMSVRHLAIFLSPKASIFSPSFHWTASSLKHATLLLLKIAPTAPSIAKWMRSSPWTGLEFTDTKNSPKVYRVTLHLIRVHFHVILHGIHVSESAPCFSCTFALVAEKLNRSVTGWVPQTFSTDNYTLHVNLGVRDFGTLRKSLQIGIPPFTAGKSTATPFLIT